MTITGLVVMQKEEMKNEKKTRSIVVTDGQTVDVCRTSDPAAMSRLDDYSMGDEITLCISQNVYKEKVYNTIEKIVQ